MYYDIKISEVRHDEKITFSIAASILDSPHQVGKRLTHIDENTSLPFLLETTGDYKPGERLHAFLPT